MIFLILFCIGYSDLVQVHGCDEDVTKTFARTGGVASLKFSLGNVMTTDQTFTLRNPSHVVIAQMVYTRASNKTFSQTLSNVTLQVNSNWEIQIDKYGIVTGDKGLYIMSSSLMNSFCAFLYIFGKPQKPVLSHDNNNILGENSRLTCSSSSTTYPTNHSLGFNYTWEVNNIRNPQNQRYMYGRSRKTLTILSVIKDDANKRLKCIATESGDGVTGLTSDNSEVFVFRVIYGPDSSTTELVPSNTEYTLNEGVGLNDITCIGDCYPRCNFKWTKSGTNGASSVNNNAVLSLGTLSRAEAATYTCEVTNANNTLRTVRKQVVVHVNYGPDASTTKLSPYSVTYTHNEGDIINDIQCSGNCYPSCYLTWTKSGGRASINSTTLSLGSLNRTESGIYTCTVSNPTTRKRQTKTVSIFVRHGPDTCNTSSVSPLTLTEGESSATVSCDSECYPSCSHTWSNVSSNRPLGENGKFQLVKATRYEAGNYRCFCRNTAAVQYVKNQTAILRIIIQYPPDVSVLLSTEHLTEGNNLTIRCDANGVPSVNYNGLTQTWNGSRIPNTHREVSDTPIHSTLYIPSLQLQDTGAYSCYVNNGVRIVDTVSSVIVKVKVLPKIMTRFLKFTGEISGKVHVSMQFYSFPEIQEVVFKRQDNQTITNDTPNYKVSHYETTVWEKFYGKYISLSGMQANMIISDLKQDNFGIYTLILKNEIGKTITPFSIDAESEPSAPTGFKYIFKAGTHSFTWHGGFNGGKLQTFIIQASVADQDTWQNVTTVTEKIDTQNVVTYWADVSSLQPGTYSARLFAWNVYGKSNYVALNGTFTINGDDRGALQNNNAAVTAGAVGGAISALIVTVVIVIVVVLVRREIITKDSIRARIQTAFRKKQEDTQPETDGQDNSIMMYEHLKHPTNSEQTNVYDALKVDPQAKDNSTIQYENILKDVSTPPTYMNTAAGSSKMSNQTYENLNLQPAITENK